MNNNIFRIIINTIKARITPLLTKIQLLFNLEFLRTRVFASIRAFFSRLFNVKPRDKRDYYSIGRWLVSKRLAYAVVIVVGVGCLFYIYMAHLDGFFSSRDHSVKTYSYNSMLLKFAKGEVRIKGKSGYLAYEGEVSDGSCNGDGTLYNPGGVRVYEGNFQTSMYEAKGRKYYQDGTLQYAGEFHENLFSGEGKLYRQNGSMEYEGGFLLNMKEGEGILYDNSHNQIYEGLFASDEILYSDLLGKTSGEVASAYGGKTKMYGNGTERIRFMPEIDAVTVEYGDEESVSDEYEVDAVYVMRDEYHAGVNVLKTYGELTNALGEPLYEGEARAVLPELLVINQLNNTSNVQVLSGRGEVETERYYTEYEEVLSFQPDYELYLHSYKRDGLIYTFVGDAYSQNFVFYYVIREELADVAADGEE